jgi:hypothetical protein
MIPEISCANDLAARFSMLGIDPETAPAAIHGKPR